MILQFPFAFPTQKTYTRTLTIDHTQVPSTQTDFPILFNFTDTTFKTRANGGHVLATNAFTFSSDSGGSSLLKWEVERYNATTGEIVAWIKIASVSSSSDTLFYLRYGASITTDQSDPTNVWTNSFLGVYHLKDGTTLSVASSTGSNNGTNGGCDPTTGQIDGAALLSSTDIDDIRFGTGMNPTATTLSQWINGTTFPAAYNTTLSRLQTGILTTIYVKSTGKLAMFASATTLKSYDGTGSTTLSTGTWYLVHLTYDSSAGLKGYVNASVDGTDTANGNLVTTATETRFGTDAVTAGRAWNGKGDELRVASVARSADWITVEYANQKPSANLVALGSET